jgi:plastocyanin
MKSVLLALAAFVTLALPASAADTNAEIRTFQFMPKEISIVAGGTITWTNKDGIEHSVTSDAVAGGSPLFDTGFLKKGESRSLTFTGSGRFPFHCARHNSMTGVIVVK